MIQVPELTQQLADELTTTAMVQLRTSRQYKQARMKQISASEDLYFGVVPKTLKNPFNDSFPYMPGFVDTLVSKLDDPPEVEITQNDEGDLQSARKYSGLFAQFSSSTLPSAQWSLKDRWCRKMAIFSGVGVYCIYGDNRNGNLNINFETKDYYDFHCEPGGGGDLESHLFCGEEGIFKTREELEDGAKEGYYDLQQVASLLAFDSTAGYKENMDAYNDRMNRHRALGLDPATNNYTGQQVYKFAQWFMTYKGVRWYLLFEPTMGKWIRACPLRDMYPIVESTGDALWPYVAWHTHEEARVFWSKAPCDDARPIAVNINRLLNQELYNREKKNAGQRAYDPEMYPDLDALADWRPDGLVPFDSKGGQRKASDGLYTMQVGDLTSTVDLVQFIDSYSGQKTGTAPGSQGAAPADQKVGIFFGELKQIEGRLGLYNKSYKEAWAGVVYRFIQLVDKYLTKEMSIKMMGAEGLEYTDITKEDTKRLREFGIKVKGGNDELEENKQKQAQKMGALERVTSTNPKWKDRELLKSGGYTDDELKHAFDMTPAASEELLSEAKNSVNILARGGTPKININANVAFIYKLMDEADKINDPVVKDKIYDYALAHGVVAAKNEARALATLQKASMQPMAPAKPAGGVPSPMDPRADMPSIPVAATPGQQ